MKRETVKKETMAEKEKKAEKPAQPTHGSQEEDWAKKLGAVPPDQCYEDSPEIARIEEVLSTSDNTAAHPAKDETLENQFRRRACHHVTREKRAQKGSKSKSSYAYGFGFGETPLNPENPN